MKTLLCLCAAVMMALTPITAKAATDITGAWAGELKGPDRGGSGIQLSFTFKQDGAKLTGTVQASQGEPVAITDGKVDGDKISFKVVIQGGMTIIHEGTINTAGDEIKLGSKSDQGPSGDLVLKRSK
jgi:hypothetical protein